MSNTAGPPTDAKVEAATVEPAATFASLSQTDHPITGVPSYYLHPCQTATRLSEMLAVQPEEEGEDALRLYLEAFIALHAATLQMRIGG